MRVSSWNNPRVEAASSSRAARPPGGAQATVGNGNGRTVARSGQPLRASRRPAAWGSKGMRNRPV